MNKHRRQQKRIKQAIQDGRDVIIPVEDWNTFYDEHGQPLGVTIGTGEFAESFELISNPDGPGIRLIRE